MRRELRRREINNRLTSDGLCDSRFDFDTIRGKGSRGAEDRELRDDLLKLIQKRGARRH